MNDGGYDPGSQRARGVGATVPRLHGPESTVAVRGGVDGRAGAQEVRSARMMLGVTLASASALGFMGVVCFQLMLALIQAPIVVAAASECRDGDPMACPAGQTCQDGSCVVVRTIDTCQVGDSCGVEGTNCRCDGKLQCSAEHVCRPIQTTVASCIDPVVQRVLAGIADTCRGSTWEGCPDDKLEDFAIGSEDFDAVLAAFPNTLTVHFPGGQPPLDSGKGPWPGAQVRAHYEAQLSRPQVVKSLQEAQEILVIGRSSHGGQEADNRRYSAKRVDKVVDWLIAGAADPAQSKGLRAKLKRLLLGSRKLLDPEFFFRHYANRIVAWDPDAEINLRANIADLARLRGKARRATLNDMNQVVFVVPIPCKLPGSPV